jgi:D-lactate dehydrogenase (cytochrome)
MIFTISRLVSVGLSAGASKAALRSLNPASPRCINIHSLSRPIRTTPRRLYTTTISAKSTGSLALAIVLGGTSIALNALVLFGSSGTGSSNATPEAITDVVPTAPQTASEPPPTCNLVKALEELREQFPDSSVVSTDPDELYAYAQSAYSQFVGQCLICHNLPRTTRTNKIPFRRITALHRCTRSQYRRCRKGCKNIQQVFSSNCTILRGD